MAEQHKKNADGDFYVERDCCTLCGVPSHYAPTLFEEDGSGCWVSRQPTNREDEERMLKVFAVQDLGCVRYRGTDPRIVKALEKIGEAERIDALARAEGSTAAQSGQPRHDHTLAQGPWSRLWSWLKSK
jgi:ferredoxin